MERQQLVNWSKLLVSGSKYGTDSHRHSELWNKEYEFEEINYLLQECYRTVERLESLFEGDRSELVFIQIVRSDILQIYKKIQDPRRSGVAGNYLRLKRKIRTLIIQLAGVWSCTDWLSPAYSTGPLQERGLGQLESNTYTRAYGSEFVKEFEKAFINEYYPVNKSGKTKIIGFITSSGIKAMEVAVLTYRQISKEKHAAYYQEGYYYEGISLLKLMLDNARMLTVEEIYYKLDAGEEVGCLAIEPALIDLNIFFNKLLARKKQHNPTVIIIDRTMSSISCQVLREYGDKLPPNVVLIIVESALKYYQLGMDLVNMGCIIFCGSLFRSKKYVELLEYNIKILTASPDPSLIKRLPTPSYPILLERLKRHGVATEYYASFFLYLKDLGLITHVYKVVDPIKRISDNNTEISGPISHMYIGQQRWLGSLIYLKIKGLNTDGDYEHFAESLVHRAPPELHLQLGSSFGFDTTRVCAISNLFEVEGVSAIRFSVGTESIPNIIEKCTYIKEFLFRYKFEN